MNQLDLSKLPVPDVIETIDYETEFAAVLERYRVLMGDEWTATLQSDPVMKLLQDVAYEKITLRARVNAAARAVLLASSGRNDLDHVLSLVGAERLEQEQDDAFRERGRLAPYGFSTAGPGNAYRYHALSAHDDVLDVLVDSPQPGLVRVTVLSRSGQGVPTDEVLTAVRERLNAEDVRPLSDTVLVEPARVVLWELLATLHFPSGAATEPAIVAAQAAAEAYAMASRRLNRPLRRNMVIAALGVDGVVDVELLSLASDIEAGVQVAPFCTRIQLTSVVDYG